jgi:hypothetical protein
MKLKYALLVITLYNIFSQKKTRNDTHAAAKNVEVFVPLRYLWPSVLLS